MVTEASKISFGWIKQFVNRMYLQFHVIIFLSFSKLSFCFLEVDSWCVA